MATGVNAIDTGRHNGDGSAAFNLDCRLVRNTVDAEREAAGYSKTAGGEVAAPEMCIASAARGHVPASDHCQLRKVEIGVITENKQYRRWNRNLL